MAKLVAHAPRRSTPILEEHSVSTPHDPQQPYGGGESGYGTQPHRLPQGSDPYGQQSWQGSYGPQSHGQVSYGRDPYGQPFSGQAAQPGYPNQPGYGPGYPQTRSTNGLAIGSLSSSLIGFVVGWAFTPLFIGLLIGIVLGHISLSQIKRTGEDGRGLALAGLIIGYIGTGIVILFLLGMLAFFGLAFLSIASTPTG